MSKNKGTLSFGLAIFIIFLVAVLGIFIYLGQKSVFVRLSREENKSLGEIDGILTREEEEQERNKDEDFGEVINSSEYTENESLT